MCQSTSNGSCEFTNLFVHKPDNHFPPYLLKDQEAGVLPVSLATEVSSNISKDPNKEKSSTGNSENNLSPSNIVILENETAKRKRLGDERFTRPGKKD